MLIEQAHIIEHKFKRMNDRRDRMELLMSTDTGKKITLVCDKGHRCEATEGAEPTLAFFVDGIEVYRTKRLCFQCLGEFLDKNIPEMREVLNE